MTPRYFAASYDRTTQIISLTSIVLVGSLAFFIHSVPVVVLAALLTLLTYAYSPRGYTVGERRIRVHRLAGDALVPLDSVVEARRVTKDEVRGVVRLWASGGLFGYFGLFRMPKFGNTQWYVTNLANRIVVVTAGRTALFSPDDVEGFLTAVGVEGPVVVGRSRGGIMGASPGNAWKWKLILGAPFAVALVVIVIVTFAVRYSPGPPHYTLSRESLKIEDRFYPVTVPASSVDVGRIRVIDFARDGEWRPVARTNGFANSHYWSGWFRAVNGNSVRLYWAQGKSLVFIPASEAPVLVESADAEGLAAELRRAWGGGGR